MQWLPRSRQSRTTPCLRSGSWGSRWATRSTRQCARRAGSILNVGGEAEYERKRQELTAKYKAEFAARECDSGRGTKQFTIEYDDKHKCAEVVLAYILTSYPASRAYGIYAGR